jgi:hypothetical protein
MRKSTIRFLYGFVSTKKFIQAIDSLVPYSINKFLSLQESKKN